MSESNQDAASTWSSPSIRSRARGSRPQRLATIVVLPCLLTSCVAIGPTVQVSPGQDKSQAAFAADRAYCGRFTDRQLQPVANALNGAATTAYQVAANNEQIQAHYNDTYGECMASRGDVPSMAPSSGQPVPPAAETDVQAANREMASNAPSLPIQSGRWTSAASCADPSADDSADRRMFAPGKTTTAHDECRIGVGQVSGNRYSTRLACTFFQGGEGTAAVVMTVVSATEVRWENLSPDPGTTTYRYCGAV